MTDQYNAFVVILEYDIRGDDAKPIIDAIKQLRGVLSVEPQKSDPFLEDIARERERIRIYKELKDVIWKRDS